MGSGANNLHVKACSEAEPVSSFSFYEILDFRKLRPADSRSCSLIYKFISHCPPRLAGIEKPILDPGERERSKAFIFSRFNLSRYISSFSFSNFANSARRRLSFS